MSKSYTISTSVRKRISIKHNYSKEYRNTEKHCDKERPIEILYKYDGDVRAFYEHVFGKAQEEYNKKCQQTRHKERQIVSYFDTVNEDKKQKTMYEMEVQIGNFREHPPLEEQKEMLVEFLQEFAKRNPNMLVYGAVIHLDEGGLNNGQKERAIHMHLDYVPVKTSDRGMRLQESYSGAARQLGYKPITIEESEGVSFKLDEVGAWTRAQNNMLQEIVQAHGYVVEHPQREQRQQTNKVVQARDVAQIRNVAKSKEIALEATKLAAQGVTIETYQKGLKYDKLYKFAIDQQNKIKDKDAQIKDLLGANFLAQEQLDNAQKENLQLQNQKSKIEKAYFKEKYANMEQFLNQEQKEKEIRGLEK